MGIGVLREGKGSQRPGFTDNGVRLGGSGGLAHDFRTDPLPLPLADVPPYLVQLLRGQTVPADRACTREVIRESHCGEYFSVLRPCAGQFGCRRDLPRWALEATNQERCPPR